MNYRVIKGLSYRPRPSVERHAEPGMVVDDLPVAVAKLFLSDGVIEAVEPEAKKVAGGSHVPTR